MPRFVTHYQLSKLVNFRLRQEGLKEVTSQQIYGALRNKPMFDLDSPETLVWIEKYVEGRRTGKTIRGDFVDPEEFFKAAQKNAGDDAEG